MALELGYDTYNCETEDEVIGIFQEFGPGSCEDGCDFEGDCSDDQKEKCSPSPYADTEPMPLSESDGGGSGVDETGGSADETGTGAGELCEGWDPSGMISTGQNTVFVDAHAFADLLHDPAPLIACDPTRVVQSGTSASFTGITTGTVGQLLGLQNGDVPLTLNGLPLATLQDFYVALDQLTGGSGFSLAVKRGASTINLNYTVQ